MSSNMSSKLSAAYIIAALETSSSLRSKGEFLDAFVNNYPGLKVANAEIASEALIETFLKLASQELPVSDRTNEALVRELRGKASDALKAMIDGDAAVTEKILRTAQKRDASYSERNTLYWIWANIAQKTPEHLSSSHVNELLKDITLPATTERRVLAFQIMQELFKNRPDLMTPKGVAQIVAVGATMPEEHIYATNTWAVLLGQRPDLKQTFGKTLSDGILKKDWANAIPGLQAVSFFVQQDPDFMTARLLRYLTQKTLTSIDKDITRHGILTVGFAAKLRPDLIASLMPTLKSALNAAHLVKTALSILNVAEAVPKEADRKTYPSVFDRPLVARILKATRRNEFVSAPEEAWQVLGIVAQKRADLITPEIVNRAVDAFVDPVQGKTSYSIGLAFKQICQARPDLVTPAIVDAVAKSAKTTSTYLPELMQVIVETRADLISGPLLETFVAQPTYGNASYQLRPAFELMISKRPELAVPALDKALELDRPGKGDKRPDFYWVYETIFKQAPQAVHRDLIALILSDAQGDPKGFETGKAQNLVHQMPKHSQDVVEALDPSRPLANLTSLLNELKA